MTVDSSRTDRASSVATRPIPLVVGAVIAVLQGIALAAWGVEGIIEGLVGSPHITRSLAEFGAVVILLMGVLPMLAGRALLRQRRWGRSPAVLIDTLCLPVAWFMWQSGGLIRVPAVLIALLGLAGIVMLLHPAVTAVLETPRPGR